MQTTLTPRLSTPVDSDAAATLVRLDRLEAYLRDDSDNETLLAEAFNAALQCAAWSRAEFHLRHGKALHPDSLQWALREADLWLAQSNFDQATIVLRALQAQPDTPAGFRDAVLHDLAFIEFQQRNYGACTALLAGRMQAGDADQESAAGTMSREMVVLWLRALHHAGDLERAVRWTQTLEEQRGLFPQAAGVASLVALDAAHMALASRWSAMALEQASASDRPIEALVAQASLALASTDAAKALDLSEQALLIHPQDGRALSAHAFAQLLAGQPQAALTSFRRALSFMPNHIGTWHGQGWTQLTLHDPQAACTSFEAALALDRNFAENHGALAVALALQKQTEQANKHVQLALRLDSANLSGRFAQAILEGKTSDAQAFEQLARRLLGGEMYEAVMRAVNRRG
ncbi:hypothetical protein AVMA1855_24160 [Acidovorax sp. SUPP1855]|uniref:hypothetical protein n=1 Tax=Acidovorax sp. SUPP1855 TaxID=431774 RepID=UPI0023DE379F|nr:hypothetical protein [Acidovorax sp. SUPP1855]GKS87306.1 hypothetical protein AVMA1855_24160 [Acidovorax sp. SUPP1855]